MLVSGSQPDPQNRSKGRPPVFGYDHQETGVRTLQDESTMKTSRSMKILAMITYTDMQDIGRFVESTMYRYD